MPSGTGGPGASTTDASVGVGATNDAGVAVAVGSSGAMGAARGVAGDEGRAELEEDPQPAAMQKEVARSAGAA